MWDLIVSVPDHCLSFDIAFNVCQAISEPCSLKFHRIMVPYVSKQHKLATSHTVLNMFFCFHQLSRYQVCITLYGHASISVN